MSSVKAAFEKLAVNAEPSPAGLRKMMEDPEFKRLFPHASIGYGSTMDFGDGNMVDVLKYTILPTVAELTTIVHCGYCSRKSPVPHGNCAGCGAPL